MLTQLLAAAVRGSFAYLLEEPVNYVNAKVIAKEIGAVVDERREAGGRDFRHLLTVEYETENERRSISGTVFGSANLRDVKIDEFYLEANPEGYLLIYSNVDRPGCLRAWVRSLRDQTSILRVWHWADLKQANMPSRS
jgi:D-3-phosphoglycerate dehydrogenase